MDESTMLWAALALCLSTITYLSLSQRQKDLISHRLRLRTRRVSSADTPPRSVSPEKEPVNDSPAKASEYVNAFPPIQRDLLEDVLASMSEKQQDLAGDLKFDEEEFKDSLMKFEDDYRSCDPSKYNFTGYSAREIKALGDFPDYSELSGVPLPEPYTEHDIKKAYSRPYRPFRWAYHQTMSLTKLETDWWLELDKDYEARVKQRKSLYEEHGSGVLQWLPGSELACKELMEMVLQFLCARYPQYFSLSENGKTFENRILGTKQNVTDKHPLLVLLDNIPEDFAIMLRNPETGLYHLRAGMICSALGWNLASKMGLPLHMIHEPIPDYKEKMQFSMDRFFSKMPTFKPIQRGSWGLEVDQPLYMPPGDPHEKYRDYQDETLDVSRIHLRVDWQTLRRLPLSGAIVFNFKGLFSPISEFRDEAYIPSLVLKVLTEGKKSIMEYKNTWHVQHVVIPALEAFQKEQIEKGIIKKDWNVHTLEESPWFPGWQEKWHAQQGY